MPRWVVALLGFLGVSSSSRTKGTQGQGETQHSQAGVLNTARALTRPPQADGAKVRAAGGGLWAGGPGRPRWVSAALQDSSVAQLCLTL